jgi:GNAT superfamily N-acetyltransferase
MNLTFRPFQASDFSELESMSLDLYCEDPSGQVIDSTNLKNTSEHLLQYPEKGKIIFFLQENLVIGYGILIFFWSNEYGGNLLFIDELFVKKPWRSQGVATRFFEYLRHYPLTPLKGFCLEVTPFNVRALKFYQKLGFCTAKNTHLILKLGL